MYGRSMISERLRVAIRMAARKTGTRQYQLARKAGLHPVSLSDLMRGSRDVELWDARVVALGDAVGVPPGECFEETAHEDPTTTIGPQGHGRAGTGDGNP
jgi:hypothetical protein